MQNQGEEITKCELLPEGSKGDQFQNTADTSMSKDMGHSNGAQSAEVDDLLPNSTRSVISMELSHEKELDSYTIPGSPSADVRISAEEDCVDDGCCSRFSCRGNGRDRNREFSPVPQRDVGSYGRDHTIARGCFGKLWNVYGRWFGISECCDIKPYCRPSVISSCGSGDLKSRERRRTDSAEDQSLLLGRTNRIQEMKRGSSTTLVLQTESTRIDEATALSSSISSFEDDKSEDFTAQSSYSPALVENAEADFKAKGENSNTLVDSLYRPPEETKTHHVIIHTALVYREHGITSPYSKDETRDSGIHSPVIMAVNDHVGGSSSVKNGASFSSLASGESAPEEKGSTSNAKDGPSTASLTPSHVIPESIMDRKPSAVSEKSFSSGRGFEKSTLPLPSGSGYSRTKSLSSTSNDTITDDMISEEDKVKENRPGHDFDTETDTKLKFTESKLQSKDDAPIRGLTAAAETRETSQVDEVLETPERENEHATPAFHVSNTEKVSSSSAEFHSLPPGGTSTDRERVHGSGSTNSSPDDNTNEGEARYTGFSSLGNEATTDHSASLSYSLTPVKNATSLSSHACGESFATEKGRTSTADVRSRLNAVYVTNSHTMPGSSAGIKSSAASESKDSSKAGMSFEENTKSLLLVSDDTGTKSKVPVFDDTVTKSTLSVCDTTETKSTLSVFDDTEVKSKLSGSDDTSVAHLKPVSDNGAGVEFDIRTDTTPEITESRSQSEAGASSTTSLTAAFVSEEARRIHQRLELVKTEHEYLIKSQQCIECMVNRREVTFLPCGHFSVCSACAEPLYKCKTCNQKIVGTVNTYLC